MEEKKKKKIKPGKKGGHFAKKKPPTRIGFFIICFKVDATVFGKQLTRLLLGKK